MTPDLIIKLTPADLAALQAGQPLTLNNGYFVVQITAPPPPPAPKPETKP